MVIAISLLISIDSVKEIPGNFRDVIRMDPSSSLGMNSVPINFREINAVTNEKNCYQSTSSLCDAGHIQ